MRSSRNPEKPITYRTSVFPVQKSVWLRWVTVVLGVICVLLALLTTGLSVKYTTERDQLKTERDQLKTERDQLKTERDQLKTERDQLQAVIDQTKNSDRKVSCPSGWNVYSKCYLLSSIPKPWSEARQVCQAMGADLVTIESKEEQDYIVGLGKWVWIGLQRSGMSWTWVNGRQLSTGPTFWEPGQPNSDTENCAMTSHTWQDYPCSTR
ncbi:C-type lectin domain family 4 member A-like [Sardina pilchardus]|uniref:C-type lectin domain family 4 member A-like n=1 Tax=Sardina pilchardus TaxID=27697 RepID=UPI002E135E0D